MLSPNAIARNPEAQSKGALVRAVESLSARAQSMKAKWEKGKVVARVAGENFATAAVGGVSFGGLFYLRRRRFHAGKRNTFDAAGKVDAFFWPGLVASALGCVPFMGVEQTLVPAMVRNAGQAAMYVGMVDFVDALALKHATS